MIIINTAYPCVNPQCQAEISPEHAFCPVCGTQQPERTTAFQLFSRRESNPAGPYHMIFGGDLVLEKADIEDLVEGYDFRDHNLYFVGNVDLSSELSEAESDYEYGLKTLSWFPVSDGKLGADLGPQTIKVTLLE